MRFVSILISIYIASFVPCLAQEFDPIPPIEVDSIEVLQVRIDVVNEAVNVLVEKLREQTGDSEPQANQALLRNQLVDATRELFRLKQKLNFSKLEQAETKIAESRKLLQERDEQENEIVEQRVKELLGGPRRLSSPHAAISSLERFASEEDWESYVGMLSDALSEKLAGVMIKSISMLEIFSAFVSTADNADLSESDLGTAALRELLTEFSLPNPPPEAVAAVQRLSEFLPKFIYQAGATDVSGQPLKRPHTTAKEFAELLRQSSGILKDHRAFNLAALNRLSQLTNDTPTETVPSQWQIEVSGRTAVATQRAEPINSTQLKCALIRLRLDDGRWVVEQIDSDERLMQELTGPAVAPVPRTDMAPLER